MKNLISAYLPHQWPPAFAGWCRRVGDPTNQVPLNPVIIDEFFKFKNLVYIILKCGNSLER